MNRRRRRPREIPFSLDSFLDVVANIVGIIIRLILVAWVGARTYTGIKSVPRPPDKVAETPATPIIRDPLEEELARRRAELGQAQEMLLRQLRQLPGLRQQQAATRKALASVQQRRQEVREQAVQAANEAGEQERRAGAELPSLEQMRARADRVRAEIEALEKVPVQTHTLHYRVPVSRPVQEQELYFECRASRVSPIDLAAFEIEMRGELAARRQELAQTGHIEGVSRPVGAFRARYAFERGSLAGSDRLDYEMTVEPVAGNRGEPLATALSPGSEFRHLVDGTDARLTVVTFLVYPDSFALFRCLRDYLYLHDLSVAGRPLLASQPIVFSSHGSPSRSQ